MALIKCPECGKEISDKAIRCPGCGYPVERDSDEKQAPLLTSFSVILLLLFGVSMFFLQLGWVINSILLIATFILAVLALKSGEKGALWAAVPLLVSVMTAMMFLFAIMLK